MHKMQSSGQASQSGLIHKVSRSSSKASTLHSAIFHLKIVVIVIVMLLMCKRMCVILQNVQSNTNLCKHYEVHVCI